MAMEHRIQSTPSLALADESSPLPLYHRIYVILRDQIAQGVYVVGSVLPSEHEIGAEFGVSRVTAKRALDELAAEGLVERARGRGTTISAKAPSARTWPINANFEAWRENLGDIGRNTRARVVEFSYTTVPSPICKLLNVDPAELVQRAVRIRSIDGTPLSQSTTYVPARIARTYSKQDMGKIGLIELIERAGVKVSSAEQRITATLADSITARRLDVKVGSALLLVKRIILDFEGKPVEYFEALHRPDRFEYQMSLTPDRNRMTFSPVLGNRSR
jgi:GntR family transcriptional regulator